MNNPHQQDEIQEALRTLHDIKAAIRGSMQTIRPVFHSRRLYRLGISYGIMSAVCFFILLAAHIYYGGQDKLSQNFKIFYYILLGLVFVVYSVLKGHTLNTTMKEQNSSYTLLSLFTIPEMQSMMFDSLYTLAVFCASLTALAVKTGSWWIFLPGIYLYFSVQLFQYGSALYLGEYRLTAVISGAAAVLMFIFMRNNELLWLTGSMSFFFLFFSVTIKFYNNKERAVYDRHIAE